MLVTPRLYKLSQTPDPDSTHPQTLPPFLSLLESSSARRAAEIHAREMLLVHQTGAVKVGELLRYTLTYEPAADRVLPSPTHLHVRIKNTSAIPLRAAYLNGPYTLHVAAYPNTFDPNHAVENPRPDGIPQFEPNLKAGAVFGAKMLVPEHLRLKSLSDANNANREKRTVTWVIEITSQILFSSSAAVKYELLIGRDEKSLDYNFSAVSANRHSEPEQVQDRQEGKRRRHSHSGQPKGVYSKAISLVIDDTESLWDRPLLPKWEQSHTGRKSTDHRRKESVDQPTRPRNKKKKKIHLVILTHGLHSNLGADMLYMKESIDATAKIARENAKMRRREERKNKSGQKLKDAVTGKLQDTEQEASTAPLSGGQENITQENDDIDDSDDEEIIVRGFPGNATRTEKGIQYLGKRLARYILDLTYPDQPVKLAKKKSLTEKFSDSIHGSKKRSLEDEGIPSHDGSHVKKEETSNDNLAYTFTSISFIGHSLGGITQIYAMAYIQKHAPQFFEKIEPINFIAMASPLLGLSNENPMYVRFALDFGLVGRTGQDLGLSWRAPTLAKSGWSALSGLGGGQKDRKEEQDPGAKPLLRILPTGPAHIVLRNFRNRTVYSNVVNDGIVPLRTSCLLFLDWRGIDKVQKARRDNGLVGTVLGWGWAEMTGQSYVPGGGEGGAVSDSEESSQDNNPHQTDVPQPAQDAVNEDNDNASVRSLKSDNNRRKRSRSRKNSPVEMGAFETLWSYIRPSGKTTKKDIRMFKRSQTLGPINGSQDDMSEQSASPEQTPTKKDRSPSRPLASRGDSIEDPNNHHAPPKTTIFESAADILSPPTPPTSWILDPGSRARTIFHDRVYHPEDIPAAPMPKPRRVGSSLSLDSRQSTASKDASGMRVEEKIARAYHRDLSWRKVLVRLEPDAHNNMIVRRMFANAYGWPVVKHLCDTHFGDTYAALTRDEHEPALDRAKGVDKPVGEDGETVAGQESIKPPKHPEELLRQTTEELKPLREEGPEAVAERIRRGESVEADDSYLDDTSSEDEGRGAFQRLWTPAPKSPSRGEARSPSTGPQVAEQLTSEPDSMSKNASTAEVGLPRTVLEMFGGRPVEGERESGIAERVVKGATAGQRETS